MVLLLEVVVVDPEFPEVVLFGDLRNLPRPLGRTEVDTELPGGDKWA